MVKAIKRKASFGPFGERVYSVYIRTYTIFIILNGCLCNKKRNKKTSNAICNGTRNIKKKNQKRRRSKTSMKRIFFHVPHQVFYDYFLL